MCILSINDDATAPSLRDKLEDAYRRLEASHQAVLRLALRLDDGDAADDFRGIDPDAHIRRVLGQMHAARYDADAALCGLVYGETYRPTPTPSAMAVEMQRRLQRNGGHSARPAALPAVASFAAE
ncbi:hypothetical protein [Methylobacterium komagatae]